MRHRKQEIDKSLITKYISNVLKLTRNKKKTTDIILEATALWEEKNQDRFRASPEKANKKESKTKDIFPSFDLLF